MATRYKVTLKLYLDGGLETLYAMIVEESNISFVPGIVAESLKKAITSKNSYIWKINGIPEYSGRWVRADMIRMWDILKIEKRNT